MFQQLGEISSLQKEETDNDMPTIGKLQLIELTPSKAITVFSMWLTTHPV
jgi:hypothetical protein